MIFICLDDDVIIIVCELKYIREKFTKIDSFYLC